MLSGIFRSGSLFSSIKMFFPQQAFYSRRRADVIFHVGVARFWPFDDPFEI
jgi:hypothetical protein